MTARQRLPNRRGSISFSFRVGGLSYSATYSKFHDGRVAQVFLQNHRTNSGADVNARDAAIAASLALQCGVDLEISATQCAATTKAARAARWALRWTSSPSRSARHAHNPATPKHQFPSNRRQAQGTARPRRKPRPV
jgi:ribonucleoside-diphosphate reductase alpha chain